MLIQQPGGAKIFEKNGVQIFDNVNAMPNRVTSDMENSYDFSKTGKKSKKMGVFSATADDVLTQDVSVKTNKRLSALSGKTRKAMGVS